MFTKISKYGFPRNFCDLYIKLFNFSWAHPHASMANLGLKYRKNTFLAPEELIVQANKPEAKHTDTPTHPHTKPPQAITAYHTDSIVK